MPGKQAFPHQGSADWVMIMLHYDFIINQKPKLNKIVGKESQLLLRTQAVTLCCKCASFSHEDHGLLEYRDPLYLSFGPQPRSEPTAPGCSCGEDSSGWIKVASGGGPGMVGTPSNVQGGAA